MRPDDIVKKVEKLCERKLNKEEKERFLRVKEILQVRDDDAIWDLLIAMEYQRTYYETLPEKLKETITQVIAEIRQCALETALHHDGNDITAGKTSCSLTARVKTWLTLGTPMLSTIIIYGSLAMWAGYCIGTGRYHSPVYMLKMPVGVLAGIASALAGIYFGYTAAKSYSVGDSCWRKQVWPSFCGIGLGVSFIALSFSL